MTNKGLLVIVSAPSGCGKDTVLSALLRESDPRWLRKSISATTRAIRPGQETEGVDYYFVSRERFDEMVEKNELLEHAEYVGNCYGTPKAPVEAWLAQGTDVVLKIEVQGARKIKELVPDCVSIFILPPSMGELERRLIGRGSDTPEQVKARLAAAGKEMQEACHYDYIIYNDTVVGAVKDIQTIIAAEKCRYSRNTTEIERMLQDAETL